jgi:hypothetical protein
MRESKILLGRMVSSSFKWDPFMISEIFPNIIVLQLPLHTHVLKASDHTTGILPLKMGG